jgi:hypothetical protein
MKANKLEQIVEVTVHGADYRLLRPSRKGECQCCGCGFDKNEQRFVDGRDDLCFDCGFENDDSQSGWNSEEAKAARVAEVSTAFTRTQHFVQE